MPAIVTDQFRILNASNFIESVKNANNSYYVFLGLANPTRGGGTTVEGVGIGRTSTWNNNTDTSVPSPIDNLQYRTLYRDTSLFAKKITTANIRRVVKKNDWIANTKYDMYRHDYSVSKNPAPNGGAGLYNTNYYVMNSDFRVYICLDNGSSSVLPEGNGSLDEPTFTDLEPSAAGTQGDGYIWKYLYTVSPSDIIKFDSTEYIVLPSDWSTSTDSQIQSIRDAGNSDIYKNQIRKVYINKPGVAYAAGKSVIVDIVGDGTGAKVQVETNNAGEIINTIVTQGGSGYTFGMVDLQNLTPPSDLSKKAELIPIIPPSKGHGSDIYTELGADKILIYARFDDSTKDFPPNTQFGQVGIIKNPELFDSTGICTSNTYSSLSSIMLTDTSLSEISNTPEVIGIPIIQDNTNAKGYIASFDRETKVLKYFQDKSLYFPNANDHTDSNNVSTISNVIKFSNDDQIKSPSTNFGTVSVNQNFEGFSTSVNNKNINLGVRFEGGLANPEINTKTGDIIYIDNRKTVLRDLRQKEDVKIILEF
tara:strand:+ start:5222 stop:6823 length:1602 start_codon:yes stop_codon:yes gene_type:complete